jgi:hypothetical protein
VIGLEKQFRFPGGSHDDAAAIPDASGGFLQSKEDALRVHIENPVVVAFRAVSHRLDDNVRAVGNHNAQSAEGFYCIVEKTSDFGGLSRWAGNASSFRPQPELVGNCVTVMVLNGWTGFHIMMDNFGQSSRIALQTPRIRYQVETRRAVTSDVKTLRE